MAVLTYLRHILDALDHPELVNMMLQYLLALLDYNAAKTPRSPAAVKRRQSLMLMSAPDEDDRLNPSLFNLVDLVLGSTASHNPQTVTASLKLTSVILSKSHGYALGSLVKVMNVHHKEHNRTVGSLNKELELYLNLAVDLAGMDGVDEAYECYLKDVLSSLESHPCSLETIGMPGTSAKDKGYFDSTEASGRSVDPHQLLPEDPLFQSLLDLLLRFLTNDVETNLALTEAIITLGSCSQLRLEGWLSVDPADYHFDSDNPELEPFTNDNLRGMFLAERFPTWSPSATPQIFACLKQLQAQIDALRGDIKDWDEHIANRKNAFRFHQDLVEESKMSTPRSRAARAQSDIPGSWTPQIPKHVLDQPTTPLRAQSPRGRKETLSGSRNTPTTSPAPSRYGGQTLVGSPARATSPMAASTGIQPMSLFSDVDASIAQIRMSQFGKRRIRFRRAAGSKEVEVMLSKFQPPPKEPSEDATSGAEKENEEQDDIREASLLHIVTNVVILQNFVLELVALMQVRASLFNEVKFL